MAAKKGNRLGRGLDTLIPQKTKKTEEKETPVAEGRVMVDINKIERNKQQPRKNFDEAGLDELSDSIKQHGIIQSIVVQDRGDHYEIIAGERRWRAARLAGLKEVGFKEEQVYTTLELRMKCGVGKCGRCNIGSKFVCLDGPVFTLAELDELPDEK